MNKLIGRKVRIQSTDGTKLSTTYNGATGVIVEDKDDMVSGQFIGCVVVDNSVTGGPLPFFPEELRYLNNKEVVI